MFDFKYDGLGAATLVFNSVSGIGRVKDSFAPWGCSPREARLWLVDPPHMVVRTVSAKGFSSGVLRGRILGPAVPFAITRKCPLSALKKRRNGVQPAVQVPPADVQAVCPVFAVKVGEYKLHWYVTPAVGYVKLQSPARLVEEQDPPLENVPVPIVALVHVTSIALISLVVRGGDAVHS